MGMFDTIYFKCPNCSEEMEAQTKGGLCICASYEHTSVPIDAACDCNRHAPFTCHKCGGMWVFNYSDKRQRISLPIIAYKPEP